MNKNSLNLTKNNVDKLIKNNKSKGFNSNNHSEGDTTDLSTHGSYISKQQQYSDHFPEIPIKFEKKRNNKNQYMFQSAGKKKQKAGRRRLSVTEQPVFEETIKEIEQYLSDEEEEGYNEKKQHHFKHVELVQDHKEFSDKLQKLFKNQKLMSDNYHTRIRAHSFDRSKLPQVLEVRDDQEDDITKKYNKQIMINGIDQNEFGNNNGSAKRSQVKMNLQNDIIQEEQEQEKGTVQIKKRYKFDNYSPRYRLKVDELDSKQKENFGFYKDEDEEYYDEKNIIEPIQEEEKESIWETDSVQKLEQSIEKLHREVNKISEDDEQQQIIEAAAKNHFKNEDNNRVSSIQEMEEIQEL
ncbi:hypothetical protein PPERSA_02966 [Pseudocohnilembus persalinus]|uniref:Uncharacterized protein n=1 Tax=Pseudocohnilembus persalinus TaxID=266149 RepID=A0A0V0QA87_PSEPJ|nr:hypothetical protein PPERSA_02966 [Pseudocohnilembus persalinus]|eukprot:KRW99134.1 hypothetical protein PPERSA_02966 [Pseudocohnilembus persalinus]